MENSKKGPVGQQVTGRAVLSSGGLVHAGGGRGKARVGDKPGDFKEEGMHCWAKKGHEQGGVGTARRGRGSMGKGV